MKTYIDIFDYCQQFSNPLSGEALELEQYTLQHIHGSRMLIGQNVGQFLQLLIKLKNVKSILELGTFTGFSALAMAQVLPASGEIITVDISDQHLKLAQSFWNKTSFGHLIKPMVGPALEVIKNLNQKFDLIFIDADKGNYLNYTKWALEHIHDNGIIIVDNSLWNGKVLEQTDDKQTISIQKNNDFINQLDHQTWFKTLIPLRDGLYIIYKNN